MIWFKRLLPFAAIVLIWLAYNIWDRSVTKRQKEEEDRLALVTAQVWVGTAKYRDDPERYLAYRDSLLDASGVPRERVFAFLKQREDQPEELLPFAQEVRRLVDSLCQVEDSLYREARIRAHDSAKATDQE